LAGQAVEHCEAAAVGAGVATGAVVGACVVETGAAVGAGVVATGAAVGADVETGAAVGAGVTTGAAVGAEVAVGAAVGGATGGWTVGAVTGTGEALFAIRPGKTLATTVVATNGWLSQAELVCKKPLAKAAAVQSRAALVMGNCAVIHTKSQPSEGQKLL